MGLPAAMIHFPFTHCAGGPNERAASSTAQRGGSHSGPHSKSVQGGHPACRPGTKPSPAFGPGQVAASSAPELPVTGKITAKRTSGQVKL